MLFPPLILLPVNLFPVQTRGYGERKRLATMFLHSQPARHTVLLVLEILKVAARVPELLAMYLLNNKTYGEIMDNTLIELRLNQHDKQFDSINDTMEKMLISMNGLRSDMAERGAQMIGMLNTQNTMLIKGQTDHEAKDIERFSDIKTKMAYYIGYAACAAFVISSGVAFATAYIGRH